MEKIEHNINSFGELRDTSKQTYIRHLKTIYNLVGEQIYNDVIYTIDFVNTKYDNNNTRHGHFKALAKLTNFKGYVEEMRKCATYSKNAYMHNIVNVNDQNFITLTELKNILNIMENDIVKQFGELWIFNFKTWIRRNDLRQEYYRMILDYMILMITINHPLRADYYDMNVKYEIDNTNNNFILVKDDSVELHMNYYKNSTKYKNTNIQILNEHAYNNIMNFIKLYEYLYKRKPEKLLYRPKAKLQCRPIKERQNYLNIVKNTIYHYTNKNISINTIRKIYETDLIQSEKYKYMTNAEKEEEHQKLLHSRHIANDIYNKVKR